MTDRRYLDALLDTALDLPPDRRAAFLENRCPPELRGRLDRMLQACEEPGDGLGDVLEEARLVIAEEVAGRPTKSLDRSDRLDRFVVERELARGGTSVVYQVKDAESGEHLALKLLLQDLQGDRRSRIRFLAEARAAGRLDHPAVGRVEEVGELPDGRLFLVMPLYRGATLAERLATLGQVDVPMALDWAAQVAGGLDCAHRANIVHRDIKPSNLFLEPVLDTVGGAEGSSPRRAVRLQVKILDFGVAKLAGEGPTRPGDRVGTLPYMSPEQVLGEPVDARADLWALGVVLYEMLTGTRPFVGRNLVELVLSLQRDEAPRLVECLPDVSPSVDALVARALARERESRFQSAAAMGEALATALSS